MHPAVCSGELDIGDEHGDGQPLSAYLARCYMPRTGQQLVPDAFYGDFSQVHRLSLHILTAVCPASEDKQRCCFMPEIPDFCLHQHPCGGQCWQCHPHAARMM